MPEVPDAPVPDDPHRGARRTVAGGLFLLLAGNALLPFFYGVHPLVMWLDYLGVLALGFWAAALAWRRARREGPAAFGLLGFGAALGGLHYLPTILPFPHAALTGPSISILGLLALGAGFLRWPQQVRMPRDRTRTSLDGVAIALAVFTVAWMAVGSMDGVGKVSRGQMILYLAQISVTLGLLALWLLQETRLRLPEQARAKRLVRAALIALLAHSALAVLLRVGGLYRMGYLGHAVEVLHQSANLLLGLAALSPASRTPLPPSLPARSPLRALLPSILSLGVLALVTLQALGHPGGAQRTLVWLGLSLLCVLMLRHGLLILDLERLSHDLEGRVEERTRKLEEHHREALSDLRVRMMAGLAAGLAHDLNNILGIIRLRVDLLEETCAPEQKADLRVLGEAAERATTMTRRILASGRMREVTPASFDVTEWLQSRAGLLRALLHPGQSLQMDLAPGLPVLADPQSIDQILQNLVTNARDAMPAAGTLTLRARAREGAVRLEVQDDGPGIPPEHLPRMFEPFFTTKAKGTGLGLATVRNLVLQNRGAIHIDSEPGRGTTFQIDLPSPEMLLLA